MELSHELDDDDDDVMTFIGVQTHTGDGVSREIVCMGRLHTK